MWNPLSSIGRRSMLPRRKYGRMGVTSVFAGAALLVILIAGWLIEQQAGNADGGMTTSNTPSTSPSDPAAPAAPAPAAH